MQQLHAGMKPLIQGMNSAFGHDDPVSPAEARVISEVRAEHPRPTEEEIRELARRLNRKPPR